MQKRNAGIYISALKYSSNEEIMEIIYGVFLLCLKIFTGINVIVYSVILKNILNIMLLKIMNGKKC